MSNDTESIDSTQPENISIKERLTDWFYTALFGAFMVLWLVISVVGGPLMAIGFPVMVLFFIRIQMDLNSEDWLETE